MAAIITTLHFAPAAVGAVAAPLPTGTIVLPGEGDAVDATTLLMASAGAALLAVGSLTLLCMGRPSNQWLPATLIFWSLLATFITIVISGIFLLLSSAGAMHDSAAGAFGALAAAADWPLVLRALALVAATHVLRVAGLAAARSIGLSADADVGHKRAEPRQKKMNVFVRMPGGKTRIFRTVPAITVRALRCLVALRLTVRQAPGSGVSPRVDTHYFSLLGGKPLPETATLARLEYHKGTALWN